MLMLLEQLCKIGHDGAGAVLSLQRSAWWDDEVLVMIFFIVFYYF